ncbi:MAG: DUF2849 domain-containing protein [Pseudomonadota bacterium]|nr:DUF2849 domain-containing protein [Pseudomonadota bacterium]
MEKYDAHIVTANDLRHGNVVYLNASGEWTGNLADAAVVSGDVDDRAISEEMQVQRNLVVDPYLLEVSVENGTLTPKKLRERLRAQGPSIQFDMSPKKQFVQSRTHYSVHDLSEKE